MTKVYFPLCVIDIVVFEVYVSAILYFFDLTSSIGHLNLKSKWPFLEELLLYMVTNLVYDQVGFKRVNIYYYSMKNNQIEH